MTQGIRKLLMASAGTALVLALGFLFYFGGQDLLGRPLATSTRVPGAMEPGARPDSFAGIVDAVKPTVVNISTAQAVGGPKPRRTQRGPEPHGVGSGFLFEPDGYVLTNNHVVESAQTILVRLSDDEEYEARIVGKDAWTDLALLKIQGGREFPVAPLGDSDRLRVGDWVLAVGNPFGLEQTVTAGIVSAKGRVIGLGPDDDFIQTDAPINPGNSGGPLFNTRGEVVGINSIILSHSGESVGIGLAVPINLVKQLASELKAKGRVTRGWLGITIAPLTPDLAKRLGAPLRGAALVGEIVRNGPAARAGLRSGDLIIAFQGQPIRRADELPRLTARSRVGSEAQLTVRRGSEELAVKVRFGERPERQRRGRLQMITQVETARPPSVWTEL